MHAYKPNNTAINQNRKKIYRKHVPEPYNNPEYIMPRVRNVGGSIFNNNKNETYNNIPLSSRVHY